MTVQDSTPKTTQATTLAITGNPQIDGLILKGLIAVSAAAAGVIATWLNAHGFKDPNLNLMIDGLVMSVLSGGLVMVWGWVQSRGNTARAVQAGINLTVAGKALAADGTTVVTKNNGATPPMPVTAATAAQIVKDFAPTQVKS